MWSNYSSYFKHFHPPEKRSMHMPAAPLLGHWVNCLVSRLRCEMSVFWLMRSITYTPLEVSLGSLSACVLDG